MYDLNVTWLISQLIHQQYLQDRILFLHGMSHDVEELSDVLEISAILFHAQFFILSPPAVRLELVLRNDRQLIDVRLLRVYSLIINERYNHNEAKDGRIAKAYAKFVDK